MWLRYRVVTVFGKNVPVHLNKPNCMVSQMQKCVKLMKEAVHYNQIRYSSTPQENPITSYERKLLIFIT